MLVIVALTASKHKSLNIAVPWGERNVAILKHKLKGGENNNNNG